MDNQTNALLPVPSVFAGTRLPVRPDTTTASPPVSGHPFSSQSTTHVTTEMADVGDSTPDARNREAGRQWEAHAVGTTDCTSGDLRPVRPGAETVDAPLSALVVRRLTLAVLTPAVYGMLLAGPIAGVSLWLSAVCLVAVAAICAAVGCHAWLNEVDR